MNSGGKSVTPNILIKQSVKQLQIAYKLKKNFLLHEWGSCEGEKKRPSTEVYCLQLILIRTEKTGIRGSHIEVLEGINLTQKKGFVLKTFGFLRFSWLFICDYNFTLQRTNSLVIDFCSSHASLCFFLLWQFQEYVACTLAQGKEGSSGQMKRWQLARGIVQGQSDLLDGWLQNKSYVDDILKKKSMDLLSKPRDMSVWNFFHFCFIW